ncbi:MAG: alpha/beta hydrolase [Acidobacteriota bacterium]
MRRRLPFGVAWVGGFLLALALNAAGPKSGFFTTSDGVRLHYLEAGSGPSLVFVPGWTFPAEIWAPQLEHFARGYHVIAVDPRSQGRSEKPSEGHYPHRRSRDYKELVDQLKLAPAVLVGWSLGVREVLAYVDQFGTGTLRGIVLVDGSPGGGYSSEILARQLPMLEEMQRDRRGATEKYIRSTYKRPQPESYYRRIIEAALKTPTNTAITLAANAWFSWDLRPVLARVDCPVLYVVSPQWRSITESVRAQLPSARVEIFEQAGHALFVDEPARFNSLLDDFLRSMPQPR